MHRQRDRVKRFAQAQTSLHLATLYQRFMVTQRSVGSNQAFSISDHQPESYGCSLSTSSPISHSATTILLEVIHMFVSSKLLVAKLVVSWYTF